MRIALVGTRGVPAKYGGFETAIEEVGRRLVERGHQVTVYCRGGSGRSRHLGMDLIHLPALRTKSLETLSHTLVSSLHLARHPTDVAIVFNAANSLFIPLLRLRRIPTALHVDGLEWKRGKWGPLGRRWYLLSERIGVSVANDLVADAQAIGAYYERRYSAKSTFIPYGAPIINGNDVQDGYLAEIGVEPKKFHLVVARFEPENHVDLIVRGYVESAAECPLVVVGSAPYGKRYTSEIATLAEENSRIKLLGSVWNQDDLDQLYSNCLIYFHGHSVGGTNPSLLRAMGAKAAVAAIDVEFNREVLGDCGTFFTDEGDIEKCLLAAECEPGSVAVLGSMAQERAKSFYVWDDVARMYEQLAARISRIHAGN